MSIFNKDDVIAIAKAITEDSIEYYSSDYREEWFCKYCGEISYVSERDVVHDLRCPALIAQDILTGLIEEDK